MRKVKKKVKSIMMAYVLLFSHNSDPWHRLVEIIWFCWHVWEYVLTARLVTFVHYDFSSAAFPGLWFTVIKGSA
jgi:hypothetical protein